MSIKYFIKNRYIFIEQHILSHLTDEVYVKIQYFIHTGKILRLNNVKTFNEKLQWLKLHDHNPQYVKLVDKLAVKEYVKKKIGEKYVIPTIKVWDNINEIEWNELPNKFVLKCTHDSGGVVICSNKREFNRKAAIELLSSEMRRNYYYHGREWPYKFVEKKIMLEQYLTDESGVELKDYKVFCFDGEPKLIQVDFDRFSMHKRNLYSTSWDYIDAMIKYPNDSSRKIPKPAVLDEMLECAKILSEGLNHARIDFYICGGRLLFGEITLCHGSGYEKFVPGLLEAEMGTWINVK